MARPKNLRVCDLEKMVRELTAEVDALKIAIDTHTHK